VLSLFIPNSGYCLFRQNVCQERCLTTILVIVLIAVLRCFLVKSLIALGWLRDLVLVLFFCAGNHLRHSSPTVGFTIMVGTVVIFAERFVWSWHLCDLRDKEATSPHR
jgi:hypothetical protein